MRRDFALREPTLAVVLVAVLLGCQKPKEVATSVTPDPSIAEIVSAPPEPQRHEPTWFDIGSNDRALGSDIKGQLDRIDSILPSKLFLTANAATTSLFAESESQLPRLRELAADSGRAADPRVYMVIAVTASQRARNDGTILYKMLTKNADRDAGRPWFIMGAKIIELHEEGSMTLGRIEMDPGTNPLFIGARFATPFVEGDRVDVVGYLAGNYTYETKIGSKFTIPAFAVAGMFKTGTIKAMNRIVKVWVKDVVPDQLRDMPRKF